MNPLADPSSPLTAIVVGAGGAIGRALCEQLLLTNAQGRIVAVTRGGDVVSDSRVVPLRFDPLDEAGWRDLLPGALDSPVDLVLHCVGALHGPGLVVEKGLRDIMAEAMLESFRINAISFLVAMQHLKAHLQRERPSVIAAVSAKVGSVGDNRSGGWYSYRMAKAALNMGVRNVALELRGRPTACVAIHPGTTASPLSAPFTRGYPKERLASPMTTAVRILEVLARLTPEQSGMFLNWDGGELPW